MDVGKTSGTTAEEHSASVQELENLFAWIGATAEELMNSTKLESVSDVIDREKPL